MEMIQMSITRWVGWEKVVYTCSGHYSPWIRKGILPFITTWMDLDDIKDLEGSSVQFSHSVVSDSLWLRGLQHVRPPCPSPTPRTCPNSSCPFSQWCHPTISSFVIPFSSCLQLEGRAKWNESVQGQIVHDSSSTKT